MQDALTADRITTLQAFRDLFASEALRPGDDVGVAKIALMFTDLKGSTAFYEQVGDARAYHLVRDHFAFLAAIIRENDGAIVKTIGDAVMAAFADPAKAVRAAIAIQQQVEQLQCRPWRRRHHHQARPPCRALHRRDARTTAWIISARR